jgi:UDP-N-acetylglucosamine--N-acetylmuramyl-(pentapeptide) pyrophosphoryl-undecaprenol N-acetylglucosamine transferase
MRILFTGGGSGGHLFPIIAVARQLKKTFPESELLYLGPDDFGTELLIKEGIKVKIILAGKLRRYFSFKTILDIFKIPIGFLQALWHVYIWMPDVVFSKGGYGSVPVVLVSWLYHIPILIHESDAVPGLANRFGGKLAKRIAVSFVTAEKYFPQKKTALVGNPIRIEITQGSREEAKQIFQIASEKSVILVMGGSQGAQPINEIILTILPQLLEKYEIIHLCGTKNYPDIKNKFSSIIQTTELSKGYHLYPFLEEDQLKYAYAVSDLIISRAGAGSIFEIAACAKPSILIPLPGAAADHQKENAFEYAKTGATVVIEQVNLTPHLFLSEISRLLNNPDLLQKMSDCARSFAKLEAGQKIAQALVELTK